MLKMFFFSILTAFAVSLFAQKGSVSGRVIDAENGQPLEYASVAIYNSVDNTS